MSIKQISVFLENRQGSLEEITALLGAGGIDLLALSLADTSDFGVFRAIVNDSTKALALVKERGYTANLTEVLAVCVPDSPGALARVVSVLRSGGFFVEYLYALVRRVKQNATIIFRVDRPAEAESLLRQQGVSLLAQEDLTAG